MSLVNIECIHHKSSIVSQVSQEEISQNHKRKEEKENRIMAFKRPAPKSFSVEEQKAISESFSKQDGIAKAPKSYDPENYPVHDIPINEKILIYIPKHVVQGADGSYELRKDKYAGHTVNTKSERGAIVRCMHGVVSEALGADGTCPLCEGVQEVKDLFWAEYTAAAAAKGVDPQSEDAKELLKSEREILNGKRAVNAAEVWYTYPIVEIACVKDSKGVTNISKLELSEDRKPQCKPVWYPIRESTYEKKWLKQMDAISSVVGAPAGCFAVLNYMYDAQGKPHDVKNSAKELQVTFLNRPELAELAEALDKMTEDWTPEMAQQTVIKGVLRDYAETADIVEIALTPVRDRLLLIEAESGAVGGKTDADNALADFGAEPSKQDGTAALGELPSNAGVE